VAAKLAAHLNAELVVLHAVESGQESDVRAAGERVRSEAGPEVGDVVTYRELVVRGGAAERVLDCADDVGADLLVVGAQRKIFRDATVIGSTTERLIRFASCPVLVVTRQAVLHEDAHSPSSKVLFPRALQAFGSVDFAQDTVERTEGYVTGLLRNLEDQAIGESQRRPLTILMECCLDHIGILNREVLLIQQHLNYASDGSVREIVNRVEDRYRFGEDDV